jgi:hypothetical protein
MMAPTVADVVSFPRKRESTCVSLDSRLRGNDTRGLGSKTPTLRSAGR